MEAVLTQAEFKTFERKVATIFANTGEQLDYTVENNEREVKVTLNKTYDVKWLDANSEEVQ